MDNPFEHPFKEDNPFKTDKIDSPVKVEETKEVKEVTPVDITDSYLETQEAKTARAVKESTQRLLDNEVK